MGVPEFTVDVFQNEYLPAGGHEVNAVLTVTSAYSAADEPEEVAYVSAAGVDTAGCDGPVCQASHACGRGPHHPARPGGTAGR